MPADWKPGNRVRDEKFLRQFRLDHFGEPCEICAVRQGVHVHHVTFRSQGGGDEPENVLWLCHVCHGEQHGLRVVES